MVKSQAQKKSSKILQISNQKLTKYWSHELDYCWTNCQNFL